MIKYEEKIIDLYPNDEIVLRIHNDINDMIAYEEMKLYIEEDGKCVETTRLKKVKK